MIYPRYPDTFWSFRHALKLISKKASMPPLGLLTIASMLPGDWNKKVIDLNVKPLKDADILWADYVFVSAMAAQRESAEQVITRVHSLGKKVVAGGPMFSASWEQFPTVDHLVLNEGEVTLPLFLADLAKGTLKRVYRSGERPEMSRTPLPMWSLIDMKRYATMAIQYSRGCPFNCEFCDIVILNGNVPRTKSRAQVLAEFNALYEAGYRGGVFVVDDNFIGNKKTLKADILPAVIEWQKQHGSPFAMATEASINLSDDEELMHLMTEAGFGRVFVGIETPNEDSLAECNKGQNQNRDMVASVKRLQNHGFEVQGGFIVGFDSDPGSIFKSQINFIQKSGIVTAMVGVLNAPPGTRLYQRLKQEKRLTAPWTGDNFDCALNFVPKMKDEVLLAGYRQILQTVYARKEYYDRIKTFLDEFKPRARAKTNIELYHIEALIKSMWLFGIWEKGRRYYWKMFASTLWRRPRLFPMYITMTVYGYHFRKTVEKYTGMPVSKNTA